MSIQLSMIPQHCTIQECLAKRYLTKRKQPTVTKQSSSEITELMHLLDEHLARALPRGPTDYRDKVTLNKCTNSQNPFDLPTEMLYKTQCGHVFHHTCL